mgnify:CR=1 FL=1
MASVGCLPRRLLLVLQPSRGACVFPARVCVVPSPAALRSAAAGFSFLAGRLRAAFASGGSVGAWCWSSQPRPALAMSFSAGGGLASPSLGWPLLPLVSLRGACRSVPVLFAVPVPPVPSLRCVRLCWFVAWWRFGLLEGCPAGGGVVQPACRGLACASLRGVGWCCCAVCASLPSPRARLRASLGGAWLCSRSAALPLCRGWLVVVLCARPSGHQL